MQHIHLDSSRFDPFLLLKQSQTTGDIQELSMRLVKTMKTLQKTYSHNLIYLNLDSLNMVTQVVINIQERFVQGGKLKASLEDNFNLLAYNIK